MAAHTVAPSPAPTADHLSVGSLWKGLHRFLPKGNEQSWTLRITSRTKSDFAGELTLANVQGGEGAVHWWAFTGASRDMP